MNIKVAPFTVSENSINIGVAMYEYVTVLVSNTLGSSSCHGHLWQFLFMLLFFDVLQTIQYMYTLVNVYVDLLVFMRIAGTT